MHNFRRTYFYAVSFISLEAVLWGLIGLMRTVAELGMDCTFSNLSFALAIIVVSTPSFILHWRWANKAELEEVGHSLLPRAIFLYTVLFVALIAAVQNLLAFINRIMIKEAVAVSCQPLFGGNQNWTDNLIAIGINLIAAGYIQYLILNSEDRLMNSRSFIKFRQVYRYLWVTYALSLTLVSMYGTIMVLTFLPGSLLGNNGHAVFINAVALSIVGVPLWVYSWNICQSALKDPAERASPIRLTVIFILTFGSMVLSIIKGSQLLFITGEGIIRGTISLKSYLLQSGTVLAVGIPATIMWLYHRSWMKRSILEIPDKSRRKIWEHAYFYPQSAAGLVLTSIGIIQLLDYLRILLTSSQLLSNSFLYIELMKYVFIVLIGTALWLIPWIRLQSEAKDDGEKGAHARRSSIRKVYLYLIMFISIIGALIATIVLIGMILNNYVFAVGKELYSPWIASSFFYPLYFIILLGTVFYYHLLNLRHDSVYKIDTLAELQQKSAVLIFDHGDIGFKQSLEAELKQHSPNVSTYFHSSLETIPGKVDEKVKSVILSSSLLTDLPDKTLLWLKEFDGQKIIIKDKSNQWILQGLTVKQAAQTVRQIAEGQLINISKPSAGKVIIYIVLCLIGLLIISNLIQGLFFIF